MQKAVVVAVAVAAMLAAAVVLATEWSEWCE